MTDSTDIIQILSSLKDDDALVEKLYNSPLGQEIVSSLRGMSKNATLTNKEISALVSATKVLTKEQNVNTQELERILSKVSSDLKTYIEAGKDLHTDEALAAIVQQLRDLQNVMNSKGDNVVGSDGSAIFEELKKNYSLSKQNASKSNAALGSMPEKFVDKLKVFWGSDVKKGSKSFIADFVDELGKSRLIGGGFKDTIKLLTYLGASWLRQFGTFGKILGIALIASGPFIAGLLGKAIGTVFKATLSWLWDKLAKSMLRKAGAGVANWMLTSKSPIAQSMLNVATMPKGQLIAGGARALGTAGAAIGLGAAAADSWKKGHKGEASVLGIGAAGFGVALLAPLLPFLAPIAPIALAIGAIAGAVGLIWKFFGGQIKSFIQKNWEFIDTILKIAFPIYGIISWVKDHWPFKGDSGGSGGSTNPDGSQNISVLEEINPLSESKKAVATYGKVQVANDGSILNADSLSQAELASGLSQYRKENKEAFENVYELGSSKVASLASFQNDAIVDGSALLYKGATQDMLNLREALIASGMSEDKANALLYTSGLSSKTSGHKKGGWKSHSNKYALGVDLAGSGWNTDDYALALPVVEKFFAERGMVAKYEDTKLFGGDPRKGSGKNMHFDVKAAKNVRTAGAVLNKKKYEAEKANLKVAEKIAEKNGKMISKPEDKKEWEESANKNMSTPQGAPKNMSTIKDKPDNLSYVDPTGNRKSSFLIQTGFNTQLFGMDGGVIV